MSEHGTLEAPASGDAEGNGVTRTAVPMPAARMDDPHLQEGTGNPQRTANLIAVLMFLGIVGVAGFGAAYVQNASDWVLAVTFGAGLFFLGFGLTAWGKYLMPTGPF